MTATSAVVEPDISEKNMLNTVTTCERPPRICPTRASDKFTTLTTTLAELISSPTRRKNGIASNASESIPSNIFWIMATWETSVNEAPMNTPDNNANGTDTEIAKKQKQKTH